MRTALMFFALALSIGIGTRPMEAAAARGLGINLPVAARLIGSGNTLYVTSLDVSNHALADVQVDFYFDGTYSAAQTPVIVTGSVTRTGLTAQGGGKLRAQSNAHFEDFVSALAAANMIPAGAADQGLIGSVLFVFDGISKSGQAAVTARFKNDLAGGTVGVALRGREITASEPQSLVVAVRDSRGNTRGEAQIYPNLFINHIGLTPSGAATSQPVSVQVSAVSNETGQSVGVPLTVTINSGNTVTVGSLLQILQVPAGTDDTILVYARVTAGNGAIHGIVSQVDATTRDGSVFDMSRADF